MPKNRLDTVVSTGVFLFFALMLSVPRGYTLGATILLLASMYHAACRPRFTLSLDDKVIIGLMAGIFGIGVFSYFYHDNPLRSLDLISRYLLAIPILLLLINRPPNVKWVWSGLIVGCISAAGVTLWQTVVLDLDRAAGTTGEIQFGNVGLLMGTFCAAAAIGIDKRTRSGKLWCAMLAVGAVAGLCISIESGSRGGWIALPAIVTVFVAAYISRQNVKYVVVAVLISIVMAFAAVATIPGISIRYEQAASDIARYKAGDPHTSLGYRFDMYKSLAILIPEKPWLGWGETEYRIEQERQVASGEVSDVILKMANTHNTYLEIWVFHGVFGVMLLLGIFVASLVHFGRRLRSVKDCIQVPAVCGTILIAGYGISSLSQVMLSRNNTLLFFLVSLTVFWALAKTEKPFTKE